MNGSERREKILKILQEEKEPKSASCLAGILSVSRQIIVGDVAILRAEGAHILATPRGYVLEQKQPEHEILHRVACLHQASDMEEELNIIVDMGCTVLDTIVEHPIYGQLTGLLLIRSRYDVSQFLRRAEASSAKPLSDLTGGLHLHTISCPDEESYERVLSELRARGFLYLRSQMPE